MPRSSLQHKIDMGYVDPTYSGSHMRRMTPNVAISGLTIAHTAAAGTTVGTVTATGGQAGETWTYTLSDPSGLFTINAGVVSNIAANPPIGSYPVTVTTMGSKGSGTATKFTITST
jgi:hypothetical protein